MNVAPFFRHGTSFPLVLSVINRWHNGRLHRLSACFCSVIDCFSDLSASHRVSHFWARPHFQTSDASTGNRLLSFRTNLFLVEMLGTAQNLVSCWNQNPWKGGMSKCTVPRDNQASHPGYIPVSYPVFPGKTPGSAVALTTLKSILKWIEWVVFFFGMKQANI